MTELNGVGSNLTPYYAKTFDFLTILKFTIVFCQFSILKWASELCWSQLLEQYLAMIFNSKQLFALNYSQIVKYLLGGTI